jgi:hypothetical protein
VRPSKVTDGTGPGGPRERTIDAAPAREGSDAHAANGPDRWRHRERGRVDGPEGILMSQQQPTSVAGIRYPTDRARLVAWAVVVVVLATLMTVVFGAPDLPTFSLEVLPDPASLAGLPSGL